MTETRQNELVTALIAEQVRRLRITRGWTQARLAAAMTERGVPWKRATVVHLEKRAAGSRGDGGGRDAVTVQELLALASVLDVHPMYLVGQPVDDVPGRDDELAAMAAWIDERRQMLGKEA